jgi:galactose mutarotase-like enzyme
MYNPIIVLENEYLKVSLKKIGAELCSLYSKELNKELIWQADPKIWSRHAPLLFPIIGKVKESTSKMKQHGFARDLEFMVLSENEHDVLFRLQSSTETKLIYPFDFVLDVKYQLTERTLIIKVNVVNTSKVSMPFSIGLHPGFNISRDCQLMAEDLPNDVYLLQEGLLKGTSIKSPFQNNCLKIESDTFKDDALIFKNVSSQKIVLQNSDHAITMTNGHAPYLAFWNKPNASFVCIEPWHGLQDSENFSGKLEDKEGIINLKSEQVFTDSFEITFSKHSY